MLSPETYNSLEKIAMTFLLDYNFITFPVDVFKLAEVSFHVRFVKYSELDKEKREKILDVPELEDSFTVFEHWSDGSTTYIIYYNDSKTYYRQRFSIGHELKHIIFDEEEPTLEDEEAADYFSKSLIAPKCLIIKNEVSSPEEITEKYELGPEPSKYLFKAIQNRIDKYGKELFDYEAKFIEEIDIMLNE